MRYITPAKGVESTGFVTRFTTAAPPEARPERGDFVCRLLSLETVLESMATGFLVECTSPGVDPERAEKCLREARLAGGPEASPIYREAWELVWHDLAKKYQDRHPYLSELRRQTALASTAWQNDVRTVKGWLLVYSLLWGGPGYAPDLDRLMQHLTDGLEALGHAETVEASMTDVRSFESQGASLIDAGCLNSLGTTEKRVRVTAKGRDVALDPGVLAALIAEIVLELRPSHGSLLDRADILDFPGGRALKGINGFGPTELASGKLEHAIEVMKRGKLTFLFEQYALDREITALCLCSPGPTKPEAIQLQTQVEAWIKIRYGAPIPKQAAEIDRPSIFVALTKFDMSLGALRSDNAMARWESRIQEACVDFWARTQASWMLNWGQRGRPFSNLFWVRNPYADQMRSLGPGDQDYDAIKKGYADARAVARHVDRPLEKWQAVEGDENGLPKSGVPLLSAALKAKLTENVKAKEIAEEAAAIQEELRALLKAMTPSNDETERKDRVVAAAKLLVDTVEREMVKRSTGAVFGELLGLISADEAELEAEVDRVTQQLASQSIKTSDKVKRLVVHMVKWWRDQASARVRASQSGIPLTAVDTFVREVCQSKKLLVVLGTSVFPYMSRTAIDATLIANILRVKVCDMMVSLGGGGDRPRPMLPVKLSYADPAGGADDPASAIDWSDVDFDAEEPAAALGEAEIVFAGKRFLHGWKTRLASFYLEGLGQKDEGRANPRAEELLKVLRDIEGIHVRTQA